MQRSLSNRVYKTVAAIEIIGGLLGVGIGVAIGPSLAHAAGASLWQVEVLLLPLFILSLAAGILLWRNRASGEILSMLVLALQLPVISSPVWGYYFNDGVALQVAFGSGVWSWYAFVGSRVHINWAEGASGVTVGLNVVALAMLVMLVVAIPPDNAADEDGTIDAIGPHSASPSA